MRGPMNGAAGPRSPWSSGVRATPRSANTTVAPITRAAAAAVPGRHSTTGSLPYQIAAQETLDVVARLIVWQLLRGMLHQVRRGAQQRAAQATFSRHPAAAYGVDDAPSRVGAVLDRQAHLDLDRCIAEAASLQAQEAHLVVLLPRYVVTRPDVHLIGWQRMRQHALHRFRLRHPLRRRAVVAQHVEEVGISADVELIGSVEHHAAVGEELSERAVHDGGADLGLDVVADDGDRAALELGCPLGVGHDEHGDAIDEGHTRFQAGARVVLGCPLAAHGEVVHHHLGAAAPQHLGDVGGPALCDDDATVLGIVLEVGCYAIVHRTHLDDDRRARQLGIEWAAVIGRCQRCDVERGSHFAPVDVEGADHLDVAWAGAAQDRMHESDRFVVARSVELDSLQEAARAVPHPHDAYGNRPHYPPSRGASADPDAARRSYNQRRTCRQRELGLTSLRAPGLTSCGSGTGNPLRTSAPDGSPGPWR